MRSPIEVTGYPHDLTAPVRLADGAELIVRAILPADRDRIRRLLDRMSPLTRYRRFLTPVPRPTAAMIEYLVTVDYRDRLALVAVAGDEIVAVARYDRLAAPADPGEAEAAIVVEDAWQRRGLGTQLLVRLIAAARERGIHTFVAEVLAENRPMMGLLRAVGDAARIAADGPEVVVHLTLDDVPVNPAI